jgi:hypothetical protein|tara:strand:- start:541 stop:753 length:213 start_codon:yes stop_codon:yes gene_type:complete
MSKNVEEAILEERKVKSLEKIANCLDVLTLWVEEIDKDEWGERIQFYLAEFNKLVPNEDEETGDNSTVQE